MRIVLSEVSELPLFMAFIMSGRFLGVIRSLVRSVLGHLPKALRDVLEFIKLDILFALLAVISLHAKSISIKYRVR